MFIQPVLTAATQDESESSNMVVSAVVGPRAQRLR